MAMNGDEWRGVGLPCCSTLGKTNEHEAGDADTGLSDDSGGGDHRHG